MHDTQLSMLSVTMADGCDRTKLPVCVGANGLHARAAQMYGARTRKTAELYRFQVSQNGHLVQDKASDLFPELDVKVHNSSASDH